MPKTALDQQCIHALRILALDAIEQAGSGHPGMPLGMADVAYALWVRHLKHNPRNPHWPNRDRFVLSAGHGAILLYSLLYLTGYPLTLKDLRTFRQWESQAAGHPEYDVSLGIEATTGPLGEGFANAVGMAMAQRYLAARFNRPDLPVVDHVVYVVASDGDLMEGTTHEAASLAGHLGLDNLIAFYDANGVSLEGPTNLAFTEDVPARFAAYHWHVQEIDGHDLDAIDRAIRTAKRQAGAPHLIICHTHSGYGSPHFQDMALRRPLGEAEVQQIKAAMDWPTEERFFVPGDVLAHYRLARPQGERAEARWRDRLTQYEEKYPEQMTEFKRITRGDLPEGWQAALPRFRPDAAPLATRTASHRVLNALAPLIPELIGGAADVAPSTQTTLRDAGDFLRERPLGRNIHFGAREHAMGGLLNGMALYGGLRVYGGTFLAFSDYMRPAVRLAAMMKAPVVFVWTHDSFYVGEDGPTHQPVEQLLALRAIPGLTLIRPADANETAAAWRLALMERRGPVGLALTRQPVPVLEGTAEKAWDGVARGAYILKDSPLSRIDLILIASGSEVALALAAQQLLEARHIGARVVSMPCWRLFDEQPLFYRLSVLPDNVIKRLAIEAGSPLGWERYVGRYGAVIGLDRFGASGAAADLQETFGFTPEAVAGRATVLMSE